MKMLLPLLLSALVLALAVDPREIGEFEDHCSNCYNTCAPRYKKGTEEAAPSGSRSAALLGGLMPPPPRYSHQRIGYSMRREELQQLLKNALLNSENYKDEK